jgi:hypothetical protein
MAHSERESYGHEAEDPSSELPHSGSATEPMPEPSRRSGDVPSPPGDYEREASAPAPPLLPPPSYGTLADQPGGDEPPPDEPATASAE